MRIPLTLGAVWLCVLATVSGWPGAATAQGAHPIHAADPGKIDVQDCWVRLLPGKLPSAAYFRLVNTGGEAVTLTAVSSNAYARTMLHTTITAQGMSHMQHVHQITVPARGHVDFAPGGYHVMLEQATREIHVGESIPMVFTFAQNPSIAADCAVRAANAVQGEHHHH